MTNQVNQEAVAEVKMDGFGLKDIVWNGHHWTHILHVGDKLYTTPPDQASKSEINSLKQRVEELEAEVASCHKQIELDDGYMLDFKCHINSLREALEDLAEFSNNRERINKLLSSTPAQSLAERKEMHRPQWLKLY